MGKIEAINFSGGKTVTLYSRDASTGRLSFLNSYTSPGGQSITHKIYEYSYAGDITKIVDVKNSIDFSYAYDHLHRLISERSSGAGV